MIFYPLERLSKLHDGYQQAFSMAGHELLLLQLDAEIFIIENRCTHMDVPLTYAMQMPDKHLRCRAHGISFDLGSGRAEGPLADTLPCLKRYRVVYEGEQIGVVL